MNDDTMGTPTDQSDLAQKIPGSGLVAPIADAAEDAVAMAKDNAGLVIVGGIAVGLLAAALLPRSKKKKLVKRSKKMAALVSELGAALAAQATDAAGVAGDALNELNKSVGDQTKATKQQAGQMASRATDQLNDSGKVIARTIVNLVEKFRS